VAADAAEAARSEPAVVAAAAAYPALGIRHVLVDRLEIRTIIGVHDEEKRAPQRVWVSLDLSVAEHGPSVSDRLDEVLDYGEVVRQVEKTVLSGHINLVETLAERVARDCLSDPRVEAVRVKIEKPDVIPNAGAVGVEIERRRG
jgi:dihydroneopterin aldolase